MKCNGLIFILLLIFVYACSSSEETTTQQQQPPTKKEPEVYVFDDANKLDTLKTETKIEEPKEIKVEQKEVKEELKPLEKVDTPAVQQGVKKFVVQVGAFTTKERAQIFINENKSKIEQQMTIAQREKDKLFLVQLVPYNTREEAELIRNKIWQIPAFKDAFIITVE